MNKINLEKYKELLEGNPMSIATVSIRERERERESSSELISCFRCESHRREQATYQSQRNGQDGGKCKDEFSDLSDDIRQGLEGRENVRSSEILCNGQMVRSGERTIHDQTDDAQRCNCRNCEHHAKT